MQPTYLPWMGYFDLMDQADIFVFLDSVQFNKGSWQQRNRIKGQGQILWLTVPVLSKGQRGQQIYEVKIDPTANFWKSHLKTIKQLYGKAPYFENYFDEMASILCKQHTLLADLNVELIRWLCLRLGISTEMVRSSCMGITGRKTGLLVNICKALGADRYLSAEGSRTYIEEDNLFKPVGIELVYHAYRHPEYNQLYGAFVPYLSILDLIFNEGPSSLLIVRRGRENISSMSLLIP